MVVAALSLKNEYRQDTGPEARYTELPQENIKWCTVSLAEFINVGKRLEASVFEVESKQAHEA